MEIVKTFIVKEHVDSTDPKHNSILYKIYLLANNTYVRERSEGHLEEISKEKFESYEYW